MTKTPSTFDQFCAGVDAALATSGDQDLRKAQRILRQTASFLNDNNLVKTGGLSASLETFREAPAQLNDAALVSQNAAGMGEKIDDYLKACGVDLSADPARRLSLVKQIGRILLGDTGGGDHFVADRSDSQRMSMDRVVSASAYAGFAADQNGAVEAFGTSIDHVQPDARLNIAITVMKSYKSLIDRVLARIPEQDNVVTVKIPENEIYDLEKAAGATSEIRYGGTHRQPMINLYRNPDPASTAPKKVVLNSDNDTGTPSVMIDDSLAVGRRANLFDLSMDANRVGFDHVDYTDLLSEGGKVGSVYLQAVYDNGVDAPTTEVFKVDTTYLAGARFTEIGNTNDSGDRAATIRHVLSLTENAPTAAGVASTILDSTFAADAIKLTLDFNASVNLKDGNINGNGAVSAKSIVISSGADSSGAVATRAGDITWSVISYDPDMYFSEENVRKSTVAVRQNFRNQTFEIPVGRTAIVDVSLQQSTPDAALDAVGAVNAIGNSARALDVFKGHMDSVAARNAYEDAHAEVGHTNSVSREYAAGSLVLPRVIQDTLDLNDNADQVAVMRESERMTELHARVRARILSLVATINTKSLYHNSLEPGETPVIKIIAHSTLVDLLFGIDDYHNPLSDEPKGGRMQAGSDYSMMLQNGTRLDIYKTDFVSYVGKFIGIPVREKDAEDVTSFATIRDRGTFVGNYTLTNVSAANKRFITNSREIPFVTNPVGFEVTVSNLDVFFPQIPVAA